MKTIDFSVKYQALLKVHTRSVAPEALRCFNPVLHFVLKVHTRIIAPETFHCMLYVACFTLRIAHSTLLVYTLYA